MADLPILFSAPMVRALLDGRKTQTRRVLKPQPTMHDAGDCTIGGHRGPVDYLMREIYPKHMARFRKGDRLWVRETHYRFGHWEPIPGVKTKGGRQKWQFVADRADFLFDPPALYRKGRHHKDPATSAWHKRLARFMPRAMSRLTLTVTDVRVQRLQEITQADAIAEGIQIGAPLPEVPDSKGDIYHDGVTDPIDGWTRNPVTAYANLWDHINGAGAWAANPWIVALTFAVERRNIDATRAA